MDFLHEDLTMGFKVILNGTDFPVVFQSGDVLDIFNGMPDTGGYVLINRGGRHEIHKYGENKPIPLNAGEIIGSIDSLERRCNDDCEVFLGDGSDDDYPPAHCRGCACLEIVEEGITNRPDHRYSRKSVRPCCLTREGLKPISGWPYHCSEPVKSAKDEETPKTGAKRV